MLIMMYVSHLIGIAENWSNNNWKTCDSPQISWRLPAQTSDGSSVITTKIIEIKPLVYFKLLTMFIGLFMGELLAIY